MNNHLYKKGVSVILPAYGEAENLLVLLPEIKESISSISYEIIVVDTLDRIDDTETICKDNAVVHVFRENGNSYGDAIRTGIKYIQYEYAIIMDADGSHNPKDILRLYEAMVNGCYDVIIGSRYCPGGNSHNGLLLLLMSWVLNCSYRLIFHLRVKDVSDSFRMYHSNQIKEMELECTNFDVVEEILLKLRHHKHDFSVKEIPIYFSKRNAGESKRDLIKFILSYFKTMHRLRRMIKQ